MHVWSRLERLRVFDINYMLENSTINRGTYEVTDTTEACLEDSIAIAYTQVFRHRSRRIQKMMRHNSLKRQ